MNCANCGKPVTAGAVCEGCSTLYCNNHSTSGSCEICGGKLVESRFHTEHLGKNEVTFLTLMDSAPIGVVGFSQLPKVAIVLAHYMKKKDGLPTTILFPTKKASYAFAEGLVPRAVDYLNGALAYKPPEKSRYMVLKDERGQSYFLLNSSSLVETEAKFLADFMPNVIAQAAWVAGRKDKSIDESTARILLGYSAKLGIGFVWGDDMVLELMKMVERNMATTYAEYLALKTTISDENLASAKDFFVSKTSINFDNINWKDVDYLLEVTKVLCLYAESLLVLASTRKWPGLNEALKRNHATKESALRFKLKKYPDITAALDLLKSHLEEFDFDVGYPQSMKQVGEALVDAFNELDPRYIWINELVGLLEIGHYYSSGLSMGRLPANPDFGTYHSFLKFLSNIWNRRDVYPEVGLTAAKIALDIYRERLLRDFSPEEFKEAVALLDAFEDRYEGDLARTRKLNPKTAFRQEDHALELLVFAKFARLHGMYDEEKRLTKVAESIIEKHRIAGLRTTLSWDKYLRTLKPYHLGEIFRATGGPRKSDYMEPQLEVFGEIARAVFDQEHFREHVARAEDAAARILSPMAVAGSGLGLAQTAREMISSSATLLAVKMFGELIECLNATDTKEAVKVLESARRYAILAREELDPQDPFLNPTYAAISLYQLAAGGPSSAEATLHDLEARLGDPTQIARMLKLIAEWKDRGSISRLALLSETRVEQADVWMTLLLKILHLKLEDELQETILASEALIFVEGDVDVAVLEALAQKLAPKLKLTFMATDGWTNMRYYPTTKLARELKLPMFCIFDGDTDANPRLASEKRRVVGMVGVPSENVVTLRRNAIEDYLIQPEVLGRTFPSVGSKSTIAWLASTVGKRNKKEVISAFMTEHKLGNYGTETARRIATTMDDAEIPEEMKSIFSRLTHPNLVQ